MPKTNAVIARERFSVEPESLPLFPPPADARKRMKCISLWQPWAQLCVIGAKQFETRSWKTNYRGDLLIHAAKKFDFEEYRLGQSEPFWTAFREAGIDPTDYGAFPLGAIIGKVRLDDCLRMETYSWMDDYERPGVFLSDGTSIGPNSDEFWFGNYDRGRWAWKLTCAQTFKYPIPVRGFQGLWEQELTDEIASQIIHLKNSEH